MKNMPTLVALRANFDGEEQFVTYVTEGEKKGLLELSTVEGLFSPKTTFAIEQAGDGLVHIKSCYNGKYLCRAPTIIGEDDESAKHESLKKSETCMISLGANENVKERSAWNCTLFEMHFHDHNEEENEDEVQIENVVSLTHVSTKYDVVVVPNDTNKELSLVMKKCGEDEEGFHFTAMRSVKRLPDRVNFLGDNELFIRHVSLNGRNFNQFSGVDKLDLVSMFETFYRNNNRPEIRVRSKILNRFWRRSPNWIWSDSTNQTWNDPDQVFQVYFLPGNQVVLRNNGNGRFCSRLTTDGFESCYNANASTMNMWSHLTVHEPVVSRSVVADYRIENANLVNLTPELHGTIVHTNTSFTNNHEERPQFSVTTSATRSWSQTNTLTTSVTVSLEAGVPYVDVSGSLSITTEKSQSLTWGEELEDSKTFGTESVVIIEPRHRATIRCFLLRARYDIPFSYTQTDKLATGETVKVTRTDGLCQGVEAYHYYIDPVFERI